MQGLHELANNYYIQACNERQVNKQRVNVSVQTLNEELEEAEALS